MVHELVILLSSESSPITNVTFAPFRMRSPNTHITSTAPKASPVSCLRNVFESAFKTRFCSPSLPFSLENFAVRAIGRRAKLLRYQIVMSKSAKSQRGARPEHQHERARCAKVHTAQQKYTVLCVGVWGKIMLSVSKFALPTLPGRLPRSRLHPSRFLINHAASRVSIAK